MNGFRYVLGPELDLGEIMDVKLMPSAVAHVLDHKCIIHGNQTSSLFICHTLHICSLYAILLSSPGIGLGLLQPLWPPPSA